MELRDQVFADLREWAVFVVKKFPGRMGISETEEYWSKDSVGILYFSVDADPNLPAVAVTKVMHEQGLRFSRGNRYFFLYDKKRKFMMYLLHPFGE